MFLNSFMNTASSLTSILLVSFIGFAAFFSVYISPLKEKERQRKRGHKAKCSSLQYWSSNGI